MVLRRSGSNGATSGADSPKTRDGLSDRLLPREGAVLLEAIRDRPTEMIVDLDVTVATRDDPARTTARVVRAVLHGHKRDY